MQRATYVKELMATGISFKPVYEDYAVQTLNPDMPNYNPAAAIVLHNNNVGNVIKKKVVKNGGRYYLTKSEAAAIDVDEWFYNTNFVTDYNCIVNSLGETFEFNYFNEFVYFKPSVILKYKSFCSCTRLIEITLPNNVTIWRAFESCGSLTKVTFSGGFYFTVSGDSDTMRTSCFSYCSSLSSIDLSNLLGTNIPINCFAMCSKLKNVILPNTITTISTAAFFYAGFNATFTGSDTFDLNLPNLTYLGQKAFCNCKFLTSITSLGSITSLDNEVFNNTPRLLSATLSNNITYLGTRAFGASGLTSINLPTNLTTIGDYCFNECRNLKISSIPQTITKIGIGVFRYCGYNNTDANARIDVSLPNITNTSSLFQLFERCNIINRVLNLGTVPALAQECFEWSSVKFIVVPSTVTTWGHQRGLPDDCIIHVLATTPPTISTDNYITPTTVKVYVGDGSSAAHDDAILQTYLADTNWAHYSSQLDTWYNYSNS